MHRRIIASICIALAGVALSGTVSSAATTFEPLPSNDIIGDFVVGPGKVELRLEPGESRTVNLLISNRMGDERTFTLGIEDLKGSESPEQTVILLGNDRGPYSLRDYVTLEETSIVLPHAMRAIVPVTVTVPEDAAAGGYYGSVIVGTASTPNANGAGAGSTRLVSRIGTLFFVTVPGDLEEEGEMVHFGTQTGKGVFAQGPISFGITFRNTGTVHLNPYGEIRIKNVLGTEVGFIEVRPWYALPDSLRFREVTWDRTHLFGYYTAEAYINRGYDNIVDHASVSFFVIPWRLVLGVFGALAVTILLVRFFVKRFELRRRT